MGGVTVEFKYGWGTCRLHLIKDMDIDSDACPSDVESEEWSDGEEACNETSSAVCPGPDDGSKDGSATTRYKIVVSESSHDSSLKP